MAAKKKAKKKSKTKAKAAKRVAKKKPAARKKAPKRVAAKKKPAVKKKPAPKKAAPARAKVALKAVPPAAPAAPLPGEERVGIVTHYYTHLQVAIVKMESGMLREGDTVHIKGHTSDFRQRIQSMEVEHVHVAEVWPGQSFGLRVREHAREHDVVYKVTAP
jgi:putative protease